MMHAQPDPDQSLCCFLRAIFPPRFYRFAKLRLPKYAVPRAQVWTNELPRNVMGKINKKELGAWVASRVSSSD